jgi:hypothetical protein
MLWCVFSRCNILRCGLYFPHFLLDVSCSCLFVPNQSRTNLFCHIISFQNNKNSSSHHHHQSGKFNDSTPSGCGPGRGCARGGGWGWGGRRASVGREISQIIPLEANNTPRSVGPSPRVHFMIQSHKVIIVICP